MPIPTDLPDRIDQLAAVRDTAAELAAGIEAIIAQALEQSGLADAVADIRENLAEANRYAGELEGEIKGYVLQVGSTVRGASAPLMAVYSRGQVKWSDEKLTGYAAAHPEILAFRTEGKPTVSIRRS